jgi:Luciferase-like monooxygenase
MRNLREIALALRSELYNPNEIVEFSKLADAAKNISHVFFPDIPNGQESLELSTACLVQTKRIKIGSGVLRLSEHDPRVFSRRVSTVQWLSGNRFVLGIGTGSPGTNPGQTIQKMFSTLENTKKSFPAKFNNQLIAFPEVFVAALKAGIAIKSIERADGLILNFCSPSYCERLVARLTNTRQNAKKIVCYVKIFYSEKDSIAERLLVEEFVKYDRLPHYHAMFERDDVSQSIASVREDISKGSITIPEKLKKISLPNPSIAELSDLVERFRNSGINLPCIYPYFRIDESSAFKSDVIKKIANFAST